MYFILMFSKDILCWIKMWWMKFFIFIGQLSYVSRVNEITAVTVKNMS